MSNVEIKDDYNIQEAWNRACGAFAQTAKADLTASPKFTVDEVLDQIRAKQDADDEKNAKYKVAKDAISKTLTFITLLGGIAAQGASMVFAPSSLCFNAISYLISAGTKYKRIFSSLAELFRRISDVLERCKIYMRLPADAVDISLRKIINEELVCFVDICALSIKVLNGHKIITALKVFAFDSDEGVSGQLGRLASLVERESQMRATLGFESQKTSEKVIMETRDGTKKVTASVDKLLSFEKKRDADTLAQRLLATIDSNLDIPSETFKETQAIYKRYLNDQVPGSGEWLQNDSQYTGWVNSSQSGCSILGIAGDEGYGKSFLFSTIVKNLQGVETETGGDMSRTSAAYYIFDPEKKDPSLTKALKVLAWQIAKFDMIFRKDLASVKTEGVNQIGALCEQLFGKSYNSDSTFFLWLDGIDQLEKQHLKEFLEVLGEWQEKAKTWPRFSLRILLTGRTETMDRIKTVLGDGISIIDVASKNQDDMIKFINSRMDKMENLSGSSDQIVALRSEILESLIEGTNGDFVNVGLLLDEISSKQRPGEIRDVLSRSGENRSDTIVRKIEYLNETLSDEDISDLNDLLTWVVFALRPLTLEELEAVLFLKSRESSLRPLAQKIRDQYSSIFRIAATSVYLVSDSIADFLREKSDPEGNGENNSWDDTGDVSEAEVRIVSRFLESVCDEKLFKKFGFDEFFQRKLKGRSIRVGVDPETAHLTIVSACLEVICTKDSPNLDPLLPYAVLNFGEHLELVDPSLTLPRHKIALGPQLVKAFADPEVIDRWWALTGPWMRAQWIYQDQYPDILLKWLQDSAVTKKISEDQRQWIKSLSSKSDLDADIMEHVVTVLARRWLQGGVEDIAYMFDAIHGYTTKIENRKDSTVERQISDPDAVVVEASQILDAANWAQKRFGLEALGYEESRNIARTLRDYGKYPEAIEQFKHTSTLSDKNWFSQWGLSQCYVAQKEYNVAIEIIEATKKAIESGEMGESDVFESVLLDMNNDLATLNNETGRSEVAMEIYEKRLREVPLDHPTALNLIVLLSKEGRFDKLFEFLQSLAESIDEDSGYNARIQNFHVHYHEDEYHDALFASVLSEEHFEVILQYYEEALAAAKGQFAKQIKSGNVVLEWAFQLCQIELMHRIALLCRKHGANNPDRMKYANDQWVHILEINGSNDEFIETKRRIAASQMALFYFDKAQSDPTNAAEYIKQLEWVSNTKRENNDGSIIGVHPTCLLARWYALQGDNEKVKNLMRSNIKVSLDFFLDDDPLNDWQGYNSLAMYLMFAGQDEDALAAWSLVIPTNDLDSATETTDGEKEKPELEGPLPDVCDGDCGKNWTFSDDFYVCKVCCYLSYDLGCLERVRDGSLTVGVCKKEHEMLHVPPYDKARNDSIGIGSGKVRVGEEIVLVDDWLQRIRNEWDIPA
ncbi:hypothetical protein N7493_006750 [Penicillium malachiteum]|uniref:Fungal STAND N-terminal Goodbye domain-containing protein n=1 Tax=Penicillium malachiteum TaxID=1324776 RepID=A0AAD6HJ87_9EURO|nr:hypothetical protein N7493_006750 [Penicillium malachiteum]